MFIPKLRTSIKGYWKGITLYQIVTLILGPKYVYALADRALKTDNMKWINPCFYFFYCDSYPRWSKEIESSFRSALIFRAIKWFELRELKKQNGTGIDDFINEITSLKPIHRVGRYLPTSKIQGDKTPDFLAKIKNKKVVFECVSINDGGNTVKQYESSLKDVDKEFKVWKKVNQNGGVFQRELDHNPLGTPDFNKQIKKIQRKKSSKQVRDYDYRVVVYSSNVWSVSPGMCEPPINCKILEGGSRVVHTGLLYATFYGRTTEYINCGIESCLEFDQERLTVTGRFVGNNSHLHMALIYFNRQHKEDDPKYVFMLNPNNPLPEEIIEELTDKFKPVAIRP